MDDGIRKGFSIVLCSYNGKQRLEPTLKHIAALQVPEGFETELILVDNASTDGTAVITQQMWNDLGAPFILRLLTESRPGKGYAVETGYDAAVYTYVLTVDDDNWLDENYLVYSQRFLDNDLAIGALQGKSLGVYETEQPEWVRKDNLEHFFVIGGPIGAPGYFPKNNFGTWGAGMVIRKEDWTYLRNLGFSFLTCKLPGKAAGEDHELGRALLMMGRKFYYSDQLIFQHFMPADRVVWEKLKQNFGTYGYVSHYNFLFALVLDAFEHQYAITQDVISSRFRKYFIYSLKQYTFKQHIAYWLYPKKEYYQLKMYQLMSHWKWFNKLKGRAMEDIKHLQDWMIPLLENYPAQFYWPGKTY